jgi:putative flippase GtrA
MLKKFFYRPSTPFHQLILVGSIGGVGFIIDLGIIFSLMALFLLEPIIANTISTTLVIFINWLGNRHIVFGASKKASTEIIQFFVASIAGLILSNIAIYWFYYVLEWQTASGIILGKFLGLFAGIIVKFLLYKYWVFKTGAAG